jgi:dUTP pyrophosphatase
MVTRIQLKFVGNTLNTNRTSPEIASPPSSLRDNQNVSPPTARKNIIPFYATPNSAGVDLLAANTDEVLIPSGEHSIIPTGISIALPDGFEAQVRSRSGLAAKFGVCVFNAPGTIDSDYRGEIKVILANFGKNDFVVTNGMRIAQLVVARYERVEFEVVEDLDKTERGGAGVGSTGLGERCGISNSSAVAKHSSGAASERN